MKCLVFSDSHGSPYYIERAIAMHKDADAVFFLGDGLADIEPLVAKYRSMTWFYVRGNCDIRTGILGAEAELFGKITFENKKIFYMHGDRCNVKRGIDGALSLAKSNGADILLFGHTHIPHESYSDGIYAFNPGSIAASYGNAPTFGVLTVTDRGVLLSHGSFA